MAIEFGEQDEIKYSDWLNQNNRRGYVLNLWSSRSVLHRANCPWLDISNTSYRKICSLELNDLVNHLREQGMERNVYYHSCKKEPPINYGY